MTANPTKPTRRQLLAAPRGETPGETERRKLSALDRDLLARLVAHGKPATVAELFDGLEPAWAVAAAARCEAANLVTLGDRGRLSATDTGRLLAQTGRIETSVNANVGRY